MDAFNYKSPEATSEQNSLTGFSTLEKQNADLPRLNTRSSAKSMSGNNPSASISFPSPSFIWTRASVSKHSQSAEISIPSITFEKSSESSSPTTKSAPSSPFSATEVLSLSSRSSTPPPSASSRSTTPVKDVLTDKQNRSRRAFVGQATDEIWPSIRNLSSSFQSEYFVHASKKDRLIKSTVIDHTLKKLSTAVFERKRTPLKGRNTSEPSENLCLVQGEHSRVVDQHRWPAMKGGKNLFNNLWNVTSELQNYISMEKHKFEALKQELKLRLLLKEQVAYLEDWTILEEEYSTSLFMTIEALMARALRLPVSGGARIDVRTVKNAFSSAIDIMQVMGSCVCFLLPMVERTKHLICQLSAVAMKEKKMLEECRSFLAMTAAMKVEECSLRAHLLQQLRQDMHM